LLAALPEHPAPSDSEDNKLPILMTTILTTAMLIAMVIIILTAMPTRITITVMAIGVLTRILLP
jgi:hypothetical protein